MEMQDSVDRSGRQSALLVASDEIGQGSPELGKILMRSLLKTLVNAGQKPYRAIFVNGGVRLTSEGSDLLDDLRALEESGVEILSCGTCLDYFHLKEKLKVGRVSNMAEIVGTLTTADLLVRP
jgi:selenium metabolism protein YedF